MPPPTGVVSGPLIPTRYSLNASTVSSGSHLSNLFFAASPANHSNHELVRCPPQYFAPRDLPLPAVRFLHRGIEDADARSPNVRARAVAANKGKDGLVRHV